MENSMESISKEEYVTEIIISPQNVNSLKSVNRNKGRFYCKKCKKKYKTEGGLNLHVKTHDPMGYLLKCLFCEFTTFQNSNLAKHMATMHERNVNGAIMKKEYKCEQCPFECVTAQGLKSHCLRKHTEKTDMPFKCEECSYATVEKAALRKHHIICHTNERPYQCSFCDDRFTTSSRLARHHRAHLQLKPYKCDLCHLRYADKKTVRQHMMRHRNENPFVCYACTYATNRKDNLKIHIKRNHLPPSIIN